MEFRPYIREDLWNILNKDEIIKLGFALFDDIDSCTNWTAIENNYLVLGCGGFRKQWNGVYEAWLVTIPGEFMKHRLQTIKFMVKMFNQLDAHRIQATVGVGEYRNIRFLEFLGFTYEGHLNQFGPNKESYLIYAMVR